MDNRTRIFYGRVGQSRRRFENDEWEQRRQDSYARATVREDGDHYLPGATRSLESGERLEDRLIRQKRMSWVGAIPSVLKLAGQSIWRAGMYSDDPTIARMAIVHTAQQELGQQRRISAVQHAGDEAQGMEQARRQGRAMADAMMDRLEERDMVERLEGRKPTQ